MEDCVCGEELDVEQAGVQQDVRDGLGEVFWAGFDVPNQFLIIQQNHYLTYQHNNSCDKEHNLFP